MTHKLKMLDIATIFLHQWVMLIWTIVINLNIITIEVSLPFADRNWPLRFPVIRDPISLHYFWMYPRNSNVHRNVLWSVFSTELLKSLQPTFLQIKCFGHKDHINGWTWKCSLPLDAILDKVKIPANSEGSSFRCQRCLMSMKKQKYLDCLFHNYDVRLLKEIDLKRCCSNK